MKKINHDFSRRRFLNKLSLVFCSTIVLGLYDVDYLWAKAKDATRDNNRHGRKFKSILITNSRGIYPKLVGGAKIELKKYVTLLHVEKKGSETIYLNGMASMIAQLSTGSRCVNEITFYVSRIFKIPPRVAINIVSDQLIFLAELNYLQFNGLHHKKEKWKKLKAMTIPGLKCKTAEITLADGNTIVFGG